MAGEKSIRTHVEKFFDGDSGQDDFMQAIDKFAKLADACGILFSAIPGGYLAQATRWTRFANPIRRGVWATFAIRDCSRLLQGQLLAPRQGAMTNTVKTLKTAFGLSFTVNTAALLGNYFSNSNRFSEIAAGFGRVMPYFILGMTSISTIKATLPPKQEEGLPLPITERVTQIVDPAGDLLFVVLNSFIKPYVSSELGAKLALIAVSGSAVSSIAKLTNIGYRNFVKEM